MKTIHLPRLGTAVAALGLVIALPSLTAQDDTRPKVTVNGENQNAGDDDSKVKIKKNKVKIKGRAARDLLKPEVTSAWVEGSTVQAEHREHLTELPPIEKDNVVVRYRAGRAYYVNSNDWKIVRVVDLDPSVEVSEEDAVFVEGYVIPETRRTQFVEVPNPDGGVTVRYYNNTAYYLDPQYRIVRTVSLGS